MFQGPSYIVNCMRPDTCILIFEKEDREDLSVWLEDLQDMQQRHL